MNKLLRFALPVIAIFLVSSAVSAQQVKRSSFDVTNYVINAELSPIDNKLTATVDVTFVPAETTRSVSFELNGSLKVDDVSKLGASAAVTPPPTTPAKGKNAKPAPSSP